MHHLGGLTAAAAASAGATAMAATGGPRIAVGAVHVAAVGAIRFWVRYRTNIRNAFGFLNPLHTADLALHFVNANAGKEWERWLFRAGVQKLAVLIVLQRVAAASHHLEHIAPVVLAHCRLSVRAIFINVHGTTLHRVDSEVDVVLMVALGVGVETDDDIEARGQ